MYIITPQLYVQTTTQQYAGRSHAVPSPYVCEFFGYGTAEYQKQITELNTTGQHLLIEIERLSALDRALTTKEHQQLMQLFDRQIAAQAALQQHVHQIYGDTKLAG